MNHLDFFLRGEARRYQQNLSSWRGQVTRARTLADAARIAAHVPGPGATIAGLRFYWDRDQRAARRDVEENIIRRFTKADEPEREDAYESLRRLRWSTRLSQLTDPRRHPPPQASEPDTPEGP